MEKTRRSPGLGDILLDSALRVLGAILGAPSRGGSAKAELNPVAKARVSMATEKANRKLFRCSVKVYGDREVLDSIVSALPSSAVNRFTRIGIKRQAALGRLIEKPPSFTLRNAISSLAWLPSAALLAALFSEGIFNPLRLVNIDITLMAAAVFLAAVIKVAVPSRRPTILSAEELSLIVGLPTEVGRLPVELGTIPVTRGQFIPAEAAKETQASSSREGGATAGRFPAVQIPCPFCGTPLPSVREPCPRCGIEIHSAQEQTSEAQRIPASKPHPSHL
jgi:hypothetical protein